MTNVSNRKTSDHCPRGRDGHPFEFEIQTVGVLYPLGLRPLIPADLVVEAGPLAEDGIPLLPLDDQFAHRRSAGIDLHVENLVFHLDGAQRQSPQNERKRKKRPEHFSISAFLRTVKNPANTGRI